MKTVVTDAARATNVQICEVECWQDLIAIPSFFAIIDYSLINHDDWQEVRNFYSDITDPDMKFVFAGSAAFEHGLPACNIITSPAQITESFLRTQILKQRAQVVRHCSIQDRAEKRMIRLMYMLRILETTPPLRLRDVALEFGISVRSVQRDLHVLRCAGHPIDDVQQKGEYFLPQDYRSYSIYPPYEKEKTNGEI